MGEVTEILHAIGRGEKEAAAELLPAVYTELRLLASGKLAREVPGPTFQTTVLVHEAWLRLVGDGDPGWDGKRHFMAAAAEAMRRILIEHARRRQAKRHGGGLTRVDLDRMNLPQAMAAEDLVALGEALDELEQVNPTDALVVKLRFFVGFKRAEIGEALGMSVTQVSRSWAFSRAWLYRRLRE